MRSKPAPRTYVGSRKPLLPSPFAPLGLPRSRMPPLLNFLAASWLWCPSGWHGGSAVGERTTDLNFRDASARWTTTVD